MLANRFRGSVSNVFRCKLYRADTGAELAGLSSASAGLKICAIADNEATTTAYNQAASNIESITTLGTFATPTAGKARFREVDAVNHPGLYEVQLDNARYAVSGSKGLFVSILGATNLAQQDIFIDLASGVTVEGWAGTTVGTPDTAGFPKVTVRSGTGTGEIQTFAGKVLGTSCLSRNTAQGGAAGSITLAAGEPNSDGRYNLVIVNIVGGTGIGQTNLGLVYTGASRQLTVARNWAVNPDATSVYELYGLGVESASVAELVAGLFSEPLAGYTTAGTAGDRLRRAVVTGDATQVLQLKQLAVINNAGDAVQMQSTGGNGIGLNIQGDGTASGIRVVAGATGHGIYSSAVGGDGARLQGGGANHGLNAIAGGTGHGIRGSAAGGDGVRGEGGTDGRGIAALGAGAGAGLYAQGGSSGAGSQHVGGATTGVGLLASGTAGNNAGISATGFGTAAGLRAAGGEFGPGLEAVGGASGGDGATIYAQGGNGNGMALVHAGTGKALAPSSRVLAEVTHVNGIQVIGTGVVGDRWRAFGT